jgi:hypothetical protein
MTLRIFRAVAIHVHATVVIGLAHEAITAWSQLVTINLSTITMELATILTRPGTGCYRGAEQDAYANGEPSHGTKRVQAGNLKASQMLSEPK